MRVLHFISALFILTLIGCNNENAFECLKSKGDSITETISIPSVSTIRVYDGINLVLKQGNEPMATVKSNQNIYKQIEISYDADTLYIRDNNSCNWVRDYGNTEVTLTIPENSLRLLEQYGFGTIISSTKIKSNAIRFNVRDGAGDVDLTLEAYNILVVSNGINHIKLNGNTPKLSIGMYFNDGTLDASGMVADHVDFNHEGGNLVKVNPQQILSGTIQSIGDVIYTSKPDSIAVTVSGEGRLISDSN